MDPITIVAIISGITALVVALFTHIKRSKCWPWGFSVETRTPLVSKSNSVATTPN